MKRSHGAGSIVQIGPNRFRVRITNQAGKRKSAGVYPTREKAELVLAGLINELASRNKGSVGVLTWEAYANEWVKKYARCRSDASTLKMVLATATWVALPLVAVTRRQVHQWLETMDLEEKHSRNYVLCMKSLVASIFNRAIRDGLVDENPSIGVRFRRRQEKIAWTYLSLDEIMTVLECDDLPIDVKLAFKFLVGTGVRKQEFLRLRGEDLDFERLEILVRRGSASGQTKSRKARRVPMLPLAEESLRDWLQIRDRQVWRNPYDLVWPGAQGCLRWTWLTELPNTVRFYTGVRRFRLHDLRHTFAASLVSGYWGRKWRLEEIQPLLGHYSITQTERYAHLAEDAIHTAAKEARVLYMIGHRQQKLREK